MWAKIKEWGWAILGILIFVLSLIGVMARRENKPQSDAGAANAEVTKQEVEKQNNNAAEIEKKQDDVVATVTKPVDVKPSKDVQEAIDRFNKA
jgi:hypothetical protein